MINIINIQFEKNKNGIKKVAKISNQGDTVTSRPQTAKHPYKILYVKEFQKPNYEKKKIIKIPKKNDLYTFNNIYTMKKSFSFKDESLKKKYKKDYKSYKIENQSSSEILDKQNILNIFNSNKTNYDNYIYFKNIIKEFENVKSQNFDVKKGNNSNKKKVSSFSMSKYIENYIKKDNKKENIKKKILNKNEDSNDKYKINNDDNTQVMNFLSEIINTQKAKNSRQKVNNMYKNNYNYYTTNNIFNYNINNTRNLIFKNNINNYKDESCISYTKNKKNEFKPFIINIKRTFVFSNGKKINKNNYENDFKLIRNQSSKLSNLKKEKENLKKKPIIYRPLSAANIIKNKKNEKEVIKNDKIDNNMKEDKEKSKSNINKFKIRNKYKRFKFKKEFKIKNKQNKIFKSKENINSPNNYLNNLNKSNKNHGNSHAKNSDIYEYLLIPTESEKIIKESEYNDHKIYKPKFNN